MPRHSAPKKYEVSGRVDAAGTAGLLESIRKEERAQWKFLQQLEADGKLQTTFEDTAKVFDNADNLDNRGNETLSEAVEMYRIQSKTSQMLTQISTNLWGATIPGYLLPIQMQGSTTKASFSAWDHLEGQLLTEQQRIDPNHKRKRNDISMYVEAAVSFNHMKKRGETKQKDRTKP